MHASLRPKRASVRRSVGLTEGPPSLSEDRRLLSEVALGLTEKLTEGARGLSVSVRALTEALTEVAARAH